MRQGGEQLPGTIRFDDASSLDFLDLSSLIFIIVDGDESIPQNVNEWPRRFDPSSRSRSAPLQWIDSIEVASGEVRDAYRCIFDPTVIITTTTGVEIESTYHTLEWVRLKVARDEGVADHHVYFAGEDGRRIEKIELNAR